MTRTTLSALAFALLLTGTASAQNPPAPPKTAAKPTTSAMATHQPGHKVKEAQPGLLKQAKVSADAAEQTALAGNTGGKVTSRKIEKPKGVLLYEFHITMPAQDGYQDVMIDATTGAVASTTHKAAKPKTPTKPAQ